MYNVLFLELFCSFVFSHSYLLSLSLLSSFSFSSLTAGLNEYFTPSKWKGSFTLTLMFFTSCMNFYWRTQKKHTTYKLYHNTNTIFHTITMKAGFKDLEYGAGRLFFFFVLLNTVHFHCMKESISDILIWCSTEEKSRE